MFPSKMAALNVYESKSIAMSSAFDQSLVVDRGEGRYGTPSIKILNATLFNPGIYCINLYSTLSNASISDWISFTKQNPSPADQNPVQQNGGRSDQQQKTNNNQPMATNKESSTYSKGGIRCLHLKSVSEKLKCRDSPYSSNTVQMYIVNSNQQGSLSPMICQERRL